MSACTENSDRDCCNNCTRHYYDIDRKHLYCPAMKRDCNLWDDACKFFDRIFQGFGE